MCVHCQIALCYATGLLLLNQCIAEKNKIMNSTQVRKHLEQLPRVRNVGVCASDCLPQRIAPSTAIVVNTKPHTHRGEHWVAIYRANKSNTIEYFDSFGRPPIHPNFQEFFRRNSNCRYVYNKYRLQGYDSSVCGQYCLTYLYCRIIFSMKSVNEFVQLFDVSLKQQRRVISAENDQFVRLLFNSLYCKHQRHRR